MSTSGFIKRVRDIMRQDEGVDGDAQRISQLTWLLFLKVYDAKEQEWELMDDKYKSIIPDKFKWRNWADDKKLTGDALLALLEDPKKGLFYTLKNLDVGPNTPIKQKIVKGVFEDANNYMKDGVLLRQVIDVINEIDFSIYKERHEFGLIYETILKELQSAGSAGEYYTPRAVTDFMVQMINPKLGESVADFACGTGGFLTSTLKYLEPSKKTAKDIEKYNNTIFGIEKKPMPYLLCITNMLLHDVDEPKIVHGNSLEKKVQEYTDKDKFDVILMNPPYGGTEKESVKNNFPADLRSSETSDLFISVIMHRLKKNGRCAVILPDSFLSGVDNAKKNIKQKLINDFNLHTIIRLPRSVFAPYTPTPTDILFFDNTCKTKETWFYRMDLPEGYKAFNKTNPIQLKHFSNIIGWWKNRREIKVEDFYKSKKYLKNELETLGYNFDLCGNPIKEEIILEPQELISTFKQNREIYAKKLDNLLSSVIDIINEKNSETKIKFHSIENNENIGQKLANLENNINVKLKKSILQYAMEGKLIKIANPKSDDLINQINSLKRNKSLIYFNGENYVERIGKKDEIIETPFAIPKHWSWVRMKNFAKIYTGDSINKEEKDTKYRNCRGYDYIGTKDVNFDGSINYNNGVNIPEPTNFKIAPKGKTLICIEGGSTGKKIARLDKDVCFGNKLACINSEFIDDKFVYYYLISPLFWKALQKKIGGLISGVNIADLKNMLFPVPPLDEQKRIVQKIDEIMKFLNI